MKASNCAIFCALILAILISCCACQFGNPTTESTTESSGQTEPSTTEIPLPESFADYTCRYEDSRDRAWEEDIVYLAETFLEKHPLICDTYYFEQRHYGENSSGYLVNDNLLYSEALRETFIQEFVLLIDHIPAMDDMEIHFEIQRIVALLNDAHSFVDTSYSDIFPIMVTMLENEGKLAYYMVRVPIEHKDLLFARLISINGIAEDEVMDMLRAYVSAENEHLEDYRIYDYFWNSLLVQKSLLQIIGVISEGSDTAEFAFAMEDGTNLNVTINAIARREYRAENMERADWYAKRIGLWKHTDQNYWYETYPDDNALYARIRKCSESGSYSFQTYCKEILEILQTAESPMKLIIDLRGNTGGAYPMSGFENFVISLQKMTQHQVYILIDHGVGSPAMGLAAKLSGTVTNAILVGTPTGQPLNIWGNYEIYTMPNSEISFTISKEYWMFAETADDTSLMPDITVYQTLEDYKNGVDTVLEFVLEIS